MSESRYAFAIKIVVRVSNKIFTRSAIQKVVFFGMANCPTSNSAIRKTGSANSRVLRLVIYSSAFSEPNFVVISLIDLRPAAPLLKRTPTETAVSLLLLFVWLI